jgi:hypothetical protein
MLWFLKPSLIITVFFLKKTPIFRRKLSKLAENCDHNIDPRLKFIHRLFVGMYVTAVTPRSLPNPLLLAANESLSEFLLQNFIRILKKKLPKYLLSKICVKKWREMLLQVGVQFYAFGADYVYCYSWIFPVGSIQTSLTPVTDGRHWWLLLTAVDDRCFANC